MGSKLKTSSDTISEGNLFLNQPPKALQIQNPHSKVLQNHKHQIQDIKAAQMASILLPIIILYPSTPAKRIPAPTESLPAFNNNWTTIKIAAGPCPSITLSILKTSLKQQNKNTTKFQFSLKYLPLNPP